MTDATHTNAESSASNVKGDTARVLEELSRNNASKSRPKKSDLRRFFVIVILLTPVIAAIGFLMVEQARTMAVLAQLQDENAALNEAIANVEAQTPVIPPPLQLPDNLADTRMLEDVRASLENRINALARNAANLQERLGTLPEQRANADLLWSEAEYLLRLANQKLQLEGDGDTALLILSAVDEMLRDSGDVSVLSVRDILAGEMLTLRAMDYVDVSGLYVRLNSLLPMIEQLSLRDALADNYNSQLAQTRDASVVSNEGVWARTIELLQSIFVWQSWDVAPEALLAPPQEAVLKQNLRLMLEQAQLALLMEEPEVYQDSLQKGADWIGHYFAINAGAGRTLQQELKNLSSATIFANRPDISRSLELLRQIGSARNQRIRTDGQ